MILQEMQTRSLNYEISVRGLFVALITEFMRLSTEQNDSASANRMVIAPALTYMRIDKAKELLERTNWGMDIIAEKTGFSSSSYFHKQFKKITGITPQQYRSE